MRWVGSDGVLFPLPLLRGTLVRRYKRFLADVTLADGTAVTAHCANSGSMLSVAPPGAEVWLSPADRPGRKLAYTWEMVRIDGELVGINTGWPNALAAEAIAAGRIPELAGYETIRREVPYGRNSRIDLLLTAPGRPNCLVEVKNVTLKRGPMAEFPDAVTARGARHLAVLAEAAEAGLRAVMLYVVQRQDCERMAIAADIDPAYRRALTDAMRLGVEALCYSCTLDVCGIGVDKRLPVIGAPAPAMSEARDR